MRRMALGLALAALSAGSLAGQEPPRPRSRPPTDSARVLPQDTVPRDTVRIPRPGLGYVPARAAVLLTVGLPGSGEAQQQPVWARRTDYLDAPMDSASLDRTVTIRGGVTAGLSAILGLGRDWAVRLGASVATARIQTRYSGDESAAVLIDNANAIPGTTADLSVLSLETGLLYRIPSTKRLQPYLELGTALSRWTGRGSVPTVLEDQLGTRFEAAAGIGGVLPLSRHLSARIHASTRVFQTLVGARPAGDTLGTLHTLGWPPTRKETSANTTLVSAAPGSSAFADGAREALGVLRLQVGISYDFRRASPPPLGPRPAAADTTSPPGH